MKDNSGFYIPVLSALVLIGVVLFVYVLSQLPNDWMLYVCKPEDCTVQAWMAATAGWMGFIAAIFGAYWVYGQLSEQRKQTAFLIGDGAPTVDLARPASTKDSAVFKITNWNRRVVIVTGIRLLEVNGPQIPGIVLSGIRDHGVLAELDHDGELSKTLHIEGWVDRQEAPDSIEFRINYKDVDPVKFGDDGDTEITVSLDYYFSSEMERREVSLKARRINVAPRTKEMAKRLRG